MKVRGAESENKDVQRVLHVSRLEAVRSRCTMRDEGGEHPTRHPSGGICLAVRSRMARAKFGREMDEWQNDEGVGADSAGHDGETAGPCTDTR